MDQEITEALEAAKRHLLTIDSALRDRLEEAFPHDHIRLIGRVKSRKSLLGKLKKKREEKPGYSLSDVTDILGLRFICHFQADVEKVVNFVLGEIKDGKILCDLKESRLYTTRSHNQHYLQKAIEKIFGKHEFKIDGEEKESRYTSIHLVCRIALVQRWNTIEIQIRNVFEDAWSEIEHALKYKSEGAIPSTAERHLRVLNSVVQTSCEYVEAIVSDIKQEPVEKAGIQSLNTDDILKYLKETPEWFRTAFEKVEMLLRDRQNKEALLLIEALMPSYEKEITGNKRLHYFANMQLGLCRLLVGDILPAIETYGRLLTDYPQRSLIHFRIADAWRLLGEYTKAHEEVELAEINIDSNENPENEKGWLRDKIPLKKSYILWKLGELQDALNAVTTDYARVKSKGDSELIQRYLNSIVYFELEQMERGAVQLDIGRLRGYQKELADLGLASTQTADPALVDTYAWVCYKVKDFGEANRAACEVEQSFTYPEGHETPFMVTDGKNTPIPQSDFNLIHYHIVKIREAYRMTSSK